jgi:putative chitinase
MTEEVKKEKPAICGANVALEEAKSTIDNLKEALTQGLESISSVDALVDTVKKKIDEANPPKPPKLSLQEELKSLPTLTPKEYVAKVKQLRAFFVPPKVTNLEELIEKAGKPPGINAKGEIDRFSKYTNAFQNLGKAFEDAKDFLAKANLQDTVADICKEAPNVEVELETDPETGLTVAKPPEDKPAPPASPSTNPVKEKKPSDPPSKGFTFAFTKAKLQQATNSKAAEWYDAMNKVLPKYNITTPERVAVFLGQIVAEAGPNLSMLKESSKYSPKVYFDICARRLSLRSVDECKPYLVNADKTFQGLYESNIDGKFHYKGLELHGKSVIEKGDGARFCGRGLKQLTGRANYARASKELYNDDRLLKDPESVARDKEVALETACWFWKSRNLNAPSDKLDIVRVTKLVNGGDLGLATRKAVAERALKIFNS